MTIIAWDGKRLASDSIMFPEGNPEKATETVKIKAVDHLNIHFRGFKVLAMANSGHADLIKNMLEHLKLYPGVSLEELLTNMSTYNMTPDTYQLIFITAGSQAMDVMYGGGLAGYYFKGKGAPLLIIKPVAIGSGRKTLTEEEIQTKDPRDLVRLAIQRDPDTCGGHVLDWSCGVNMLAE